MQDFQRVPRTEIIRVTPDVLPGSMPPVAMYRNLCECLTKSLSCTQLKLQSARLVNLQLRRDLSAF